MKKLYLIRHAKSSWDNPELDDFDRPLNSRGEKDAPRMGKRLREKKITPDGVITSPANRALKTCKLICKIVGFDEKKIIEIPSLYHAGEDEILKIVRGIKDRTQDEEENILLVGHNPGLTEFANRLTNENIQNIPTTGVVAIQLGIEKWKDTKWGTGSLVFFDFPKKKED